MKTKNSNPAKFLEGKSVGIIDDVRLDLNSPELLEILNELELV